MSENSTPSGQIPHYTTAEVAKLLGMAVRSVQLMVDLPPKHDPRRHPRNVLDLHLVCEPPRRRSRYQIV